MQTGLMPGRCEFLQGFLRPASQNQHGAAIGRILHTNLAHKGVFTDSCPQSLGHRLLGGPAAGISGQRITLGFGALLLGWGIDTVKETLIELLKRFFKTARVYLVVTDTDNHRL